MDYKDTERLKLKEEGKCINYAKYCSETILYVFIIKKLVIKIDL
jgi:hypothetical protein